MPAGLELTAGSTGRGTGRCTRRAWSGREAFGDAAPTVLVRQPTERESPGAIDEATGRYLIKVGVGSLAATGPIRHAPGLEWRAERPDWPAPNTKIGDQNG